MQRSMSNSASKYFLPIILVLLSTLGMLAAFGIQTLNNNTSAPSQTTVANDATYLSGQTSIERPSSHGNGGPINLEATETEVEEDELVPSRKLLRKASVYSALCLAFLLGYFGHLLRNNFSQHGYFFSLTPNKRFILFRVLRL